MKKHSTKFVIAILACIFLGILSYLVYNLLQDKLQDKAYNAEIASLQKIRPDTDIAATASDGTAESGSPEATLNYLADLQGVNSDVVAWLRVPDTNIDFPIVQSDDNAYYLTHGLERETTVLGVPFLDYRCAKDFTGFNSIIYGHHIKNGRLFSNLDKFREEAFFNEHETATLITEDKIYTINIIACLITPSDSFVYNAVFLTEREREVFLEQIPESAKRLRDFSIDELKNKNIITLSTCAYEYDGARTVVVGYLTQP